MSLPRIADVVRVVAEPNLKFTNAGRAVCSLRVVMDKRKKDEATGEWTTSAEIWMNATAWGQLGENIVESGITKGSELLVVGELSQREYERNDGSKGASLELNIFKAGPDLNRNVAKVTKAARSSSGEWQGGGGFGNAPSGGGFGSQGGGDPFAQNYSDSADIAPF